jgi:lipoate-protein ligase A
MFIRINNVNYFVITDNKTPREIYEEIFSRMNKTYMSVREKKEMMFEITKQILSK